MRVLVACEFSGIVRNAFSSAGHDAWSCDLLPSETEGNHLVGDVRNHIWPPGQWDLLIAHPPCTHLAVSGARWFKNKIGEQQAALVFVRELLNAPIHRIALENPVSIISSRIRKPDQVIQPWMFGHGEVEATCLWLKNLPLAQKPAVPHANAHRKTRPVRARCTAGTHRQSPPHGAVSRSLEREISHHDRHRQRHGTPMGTP